MARTTIEIDGGLPSRVMRRYRLPTKRAAIDLALRRLDLEPMTRDAALAMRGTGWEGDLSRLREGTSTRRRDADFDAIAHPCALLVAPT